MTEFLAKESLKNKFVNMNEIWKIITLKFNVTSDSNQELMGDDPFDVPLIVTIETISQTG